MSETIYETIVVETCCTCGVTFGVTEGFYNLRQRDGNSFYCPNGHCQYYTNNEKKKLNDLKKDLQRTQESMQFWREQAEEKGRSLSATRGQITKIKNRVAKGICPCCNRQFENLHDHMETKHPNYGKAS
jgi:hypothetical protein